MEMRVKNKISLSHFSFRSV